MGSISELSCSATLATKVTSVFTAAILSGQHGYSHLFESRENINNSPSAPMNFCKP